jgi:hypothetical protein
MVSSSRRDQAADGALDLVGGARGLLDAGAGGHAHVQADLAAIHVGEEVAPEHGYSRQDSRQNPRKPSAKRRRCASSEDSTSV